MRASQPAATAVADTSDDASLLVEVCAAFGLGPPQRSEVVTQGLMNRNWRVSIGSGTYAVKEIRDVDAAQAAFEHAAMARLAGAGLPVPRPLATPGGDTVALIGARPYAMLPWAPGEHVSALDWTHAQCAHVGWLLGRIHVQLRETVPAEQMSVVVTVPEVAKAEADIDRYLGLIADRPSRDDFDAYVVEQLTLRRRLLDDVTHLRPDERVELAPAGYVHGDFHDLNLLFTGDRVSAVLDWDRLRVRAWCYELVRSATLMFGYGDQRGLDTERVAAFAAGYAAVAGVTAEQVVAAADRLWWERVCDFWQLKLHYLKHDTSCDHLFRSASALLPWWCAYRTEVADALTTR